MAVKDPTKIQVVVPSNGMDQIVDIVTGTFTAAPATGSGFAGTYASTNTVDEHNAIADDFFYTAGIWSMDGGATWNQIGASVIVGNDSVVGQLTLSIGVSSTGSLDADPGKIVVNANNEGFSPQTIQYKVLVMARFDQSTKIPTKKLNQVLRYSTKNSYMKIAIENKTGVLPASGVTTIPHNLGYVPNFMAWILSDDSPSGNTDYGMFPAGDRVSADTQNLYCDYNSFAGFANYTLYYRIYLNA